MFQNIFKTHKLLLVISFLIFSCKNSDFDDASKRNENWAYWIDTNTGKASWIPIKNKTTVENGEYYLFYTDGKIFEKGKLRNGKPVDTIYRYDENENIIRYKIIQQDTSYHVYLKEGYYIEKYQNGSIFQKGTVKDNGFNDDWIGYYPNGQIEWMQEFKDKTGMVSWYYENGQISSIGNYVDGKSEGQTKIWHLNGNLEEVSYWKNGLQDSIFTTYYKNGSLESKSYFKKGKFNGKSEDWFENGQIKVSSFYENGQLHGLFRQWKETGEIEVDGSYNYGKLKAKVYNYHANGLVSVEGYLNDKQLEGVWNLFDEKGKLIKIRYFENGALVKEELLE